MRNLLILLMLAMSASLAQAQDSLDFARKATRRTCSSWNANGTLVKLHGSAYKEGQDKAGTAIAMGIVFPLAALFKHGEQAEIKKGTSFTGYVDSDVNLTSAK